MPSATVEWGALLFGIVVGWITHRILTRQETSSIGDIAAVIGAVGGGTITVLYPAQVNNAQNPIFAFYSIGLFIGFFFYFVFAVIDKILLGGALRDVKILSGG
jgi:uncharacterized membrane protein YeaQ/YmgE (transglycosylase-associated protein family)